VAYLQTALVAYLQTALVAYLWAVLVAMPPLLRMPIVHR
jgi:hypothetical protein